MWQINTREYPLPAIPPLEVLLAMVEEYRGIFLFHAGQCTGNDLLGLNPVVMITDRTLCRGGHSEPLNDPLACLDEILRCNRGWQQGPDRFSPTLLGYVAYDYKDKLEEAGIYQPSYPRDQPRSHGRAASEARDQPHYATSPGCMDSFPELYFALFQYYIAYNNATGQGSLIELQFPFPFASLTRHEIFAHKGLSRPTGAQVSCYTGTSLPRRDFQQAVNRTIDYIKTGDIYQANITRAITGTTELTPGEIASRLYRSNNIDFGVYARIGDSYLISTSPERFFTVRGEKILTSPIKGTIKKSSNPAENEKNKQALLSSQKNLAELAMIVDLLRNDISRICRPGSVKVEDYPILKELHNVYHLVADISGLLNPGTTLGQILRAVFPGGSISGCPKIRACQIIEELEPVKRGLYTGSFGYINCGGGMDFNIMIRTLFISGNEFVFNTGGGITLLSDPADEYEETIHKIRTICKAINLEEIWDERYCLTGK